MITYFMAKLIGKKAEVPLKCAVSATIASAVTLPADTVNDFGSVIKGGEVEMKHFERMQGLLTDAFGLSKKEKKSLGCLAGEIAGTVVGGTASTAAITVLSGGTAGPAATAVGLARTGATLNRAATAYEAAIKTAAATNAVVAAGSVRDGAKVGLEMVLAP